MAIVAATKATVVALKLIAALAVSIAVLRFYVSFVRHWLIYVFRSTRFRRLQS
jgi:hypothetical protein